MFVHPGSLIGGVALGAAGAAWLARRRAGRERETARRALEEQARALERLRQEAGVAARAKADFLSCISHEVRTPLNALLGSVDLLAESPLAEPQRQRLAVVRQAAETLLALVQDTLDFARLGRGELGFTPEPFSPAELARRTLALHAVEAEAKGLALRCELAPGLAAQVFGDPLRVQQILLHLLGNALKFTERGEVALGLASRLEPDGRVRLELTVSDTGIGVPPELREAVFDAFTQADGSSTRRHGGAGLGVALCRRLAERMGGGIQMHSEPGRGSRFVVELLLDAAAAEAPPAAAVPEGAFRRPPAPRAGASRLLLVEDSVDNRRLIRAYLQGQPVHIDEAEDGLRGLERFKADRYDLVLMDLQMPVMDGHAAMAAMRAWEREGGRAATPILVVTASEAADEVERSLAAGCTAHLSKPIRKATLLEALSRYIPVSA